MSQQNKITSLDFVRQALTDHANQLPPAAGLAFSSFVPGVLADIDAELVAAKQLHEENATLEAKAEDQATRIAALEEVNSGLTARMAELAGGARIVDMDPAPGVPAGRPLPAKPNGKAVHAVKG
jgi:hypothetical protein